MTYLRMPRCRTIALAVSLAAVQNTASAAAIQPKTSCTQNSVQVPCGTVESPAGVVFMPSGLDTPNVSLLLGATAFAGVPVAPQIFSTSASASVHLYLQGAGPVRPGFAMFYVATDLEGSVPGEGASAKATIAGLGTCSGSMCNSGPPSPVPFMLGVPFEIHLSAAAFVSVIEPEFEALGATGAAGIEISLFDAEMNPVNISVAEVPEPSTWALMCLGIAGYGAFQRRSRGKLPPM